MAHPMRISDLGCRIDQSEIPQSAIRNARSLCCGCWERPDKYARLAPLRLLDSRRRPQGPSRSSVQSLRLRTFAQLGELLRLAEHRQPGLRLRIHSNQMTSRVGDAEHGVVDVEPNHRLDEVQILGE